MKRYGLVLAAMLTALSGGCGLDPYAAALQERWQTQEELVHILSSVRDEASMAAAGEKLHQNFRRFDEASRRLTQLHKPSGETLRQIEAEWAPKLQLALDRSNQEVSRIGKLPGGPEFIAALNNLK